MSPGNKTRQRYASIETTLAVWRTLQATKAVDPQMTLCPDGSIVVDCREASFTIPAYTADEAPGAVAPCVYIIGADSTERVKIGVATDPGKRLRALQTANPDRLSLLATAPGGYALEKKLHAALRPHHIAGEWFRRGAWLDRLLESVAAGDKPAAILKSLGASSR